MPQGSRASRGKPIVNMFPLEEGEKITAVVPVKEFDENHYVFMATAQGTVKKTPLADFSRPRPSGIIAVGLDEGDYLVGRGAHRRQVRRDAVLLRRQGGALRRKATCGRWAARPPACAACASAPAQRVVCMLAANDESKSVLTATENGFGKRTPIAEYPRHGRGGAGRDRDPDLRAQRRRWSARCWSTTTTR